MSVLTLLLIGGGYAALVAKAGWYGVLLILIHWAIMGLAVRPRIRR